MKPNLLQIALLLVVICGSACCSTDTKSNQALVAPLRLANVAAQPWVQGPVVRGEWSAVDRNQGHFDLSVHWPGRQHAPTVDIEYWVTDEKVDSGRIESKWIEHVTLPTMLPIDVRFRSDAALDGQNDVPAVRVMFAITECDAAIETWEVEIAACADADRRFIEHAHPQFFLKPQQPQISGAVGFKRHRTLSNATRVDTPKCELQVMHGNGGDIVAVTVWFETEEPQLWMERSLDDASVHKVSASDTTPFIVAPSDFTEVPPYFDGAVTEVYLFIDVEVATDDGTRLHWRYASDAFDLTPLHSFGAGPIDYDFMLGDDDRFLSASLLPSHE